MQKSDDYLGQFQITPVLHWGLYDPPLKLQWFKIERFGEYAGELLAGFELFRDDDGSGVPFPPMGKDRYWQIMPPIKPVLARFRVQVRISQTIMECMEHYNMHVCSCMLKLRFTYA